MMLMEARKPQIPVAKCYMTVTLITDFYVAKQKYMS